MSAKDFKFVSPGVFIEEIDNSQVPKSPVAIGPLVVGRTRRGPAYQPVRVDSFSEFVTIFGNPVAGEEASDLWRDGKPTAPTFAAYAAQAWLKNSSPLTVIRLLGDQSPNAADTANGKAGWKLSDIDAETGGGAYGLFVLPSSSAVAETPTGTLAAVFIRQEVSSPFPEPLEGLKTLYQSHKARMAKLLVPQQGLPLLLLVIAESSHFKLTIAVKFSKKRPRLVLTEAPQTTLERLLILTLL